MWHLVNTLIGLFSDFLGKIDSVYIYLAGALVAAVAALGFASLFAGIASWVERRIAGRIMSRIGPNRVGPQGILQFLADGLKLIMKEDIQPAGCDHLLFRFAPYLVFAGMFGTFVALPFGAHIIASNLDVGIFYIISITSLVVVGIIFGGWASNSKWSLFGGLRTAAQILSYEIPLALSLVVVILLSGSLSTQKIIAAQGGMPWDWFIFSNPFSFVAFFIYLTAAIAEGNRTPFDLPEAESELVSGYNTEYSGFRFVVFFFAEWANLWIMSAIAVLCFLGGWQVPFMATPTDRIDLVYELLSLVSFSVKTLVLVFFVIQIRWTLPRLRLDQMMSLSWKYLTPIAFFAILGTMTWMVLFDAPSLIGQISRYGMSMIGAVILLYYIKRIVFNYTADSSLYKRMTGVSQWYPPYRLP